MSRWLSLMLVIAAGAGSRPAAADEILRFDWAPSPIAAHEAALAEIRHKNGLVAEPCAGPLCVAFHRTTARPQDRWLEGRIELAASVDRGRTRLTAELYPLGSGQPAASAQASPGEGPGSLLVDLRAARLAKARLVVKLDVAGRPADVVETLLAAAAPPLALADGQRIPIELDAGPHDPAQPAWVTFGVPFPAGALESADRLCLVDGQGRPLTHQKEVTGLWAREGAIQWVRFDAIVTPREGCFVEVSHAPRPEPEAGLTVASREGRVTVDTGAAQYVLTPGLSPVEEVRMAGRRVAHAAGTRGLYLVDSQGQVASAVADGATMLVEAAGPQAACVRFEGDYRTADGTRMARHITRLEFMAGRPDARIQHTLVLTEDSNRVWFTDVGWDLALEGPAAEAVFAGACDAAQPVRVALDATDAAAWMLQDAHYRFAEGENHFAIARQPAGGQPSPVAEGRECGDWMAVAGPGGGLGWSCRDAARQHPKEFEARADRAVLHLFSSRGGEELDFRMPALVKKWNLEPWLKAVLPVRKKAQAADLVQEALKIKDNAVGWSKTHHLLLAPLPAAGAGTALARLAAEHSRPVYARPDPGWICRTAAMGALAPRDPQQFPEVEAALDGAMQWWHARIGDWGEYGFVDYYAGPHLSYVGKYPGDKRYHWAVYGLRTGVWHAYARGGDAATRELAQRGTQTFMDSIFCHWDGPGKSKGLLLGINEGGDEPATPATLPLYWQAGTEFEISGSTDLRQLLWDYHLCGNRRAKDVVVQYGEAAKQLWTPKLIQEQWRILMAFRCLVQVYGLTWDPHLRRIAEATIDVFHDRAGAIGLTKERPFHSSTYKTQSDVTGLLEAVEILDDPRCAPIARQVVDFLWPSYWATTPLTYNSPVGRIGHFLYGETADRSIPEALAIQLRWIAALYDRQAGAFRTAIGAHSMLFLTQGVPYAQDVVRRAGVWDEPAVAWAAADDLGQPLSFVVLKPEDEAVRLRMHLPPGSGAGAAGGAVELRPLAAKTGWGMDLNRVTTDSDDNVLIEIPKDAPGGAYEIRSSRTGPQFLLADRRLPLVLHAPGYWQPVPPQDPPQRWFFQVPEKSEDAAVFFEGSARLFGPDGSDWDEGRPQHGWVSLPADRPGLWSFTPLESRLVRVRNLPPAFALRSPDHWFEPPIAWSREPAPPAAADPKDEFVEGAIQTPGNRALQLAGRRSLRLEAGPPRADGDGGQFLPFAQGTIEFFYRPRWSTAELTHGGSLLALDTSGDSWGLGLMHNPEAEGWFQMHSWLAMFLTDGASGRRSIRNYRSALLEKDRWVHVAWVWGVRRDLAIRGSGGLLAKAKEGMLTNLVYLDGQPGRIAPDQVPGNRPALAPVRLRTGAAFDGALDELRISDSLRYLGPFSPPGRDRELGLDEHTRALFHFNGTLDGESPAQAGPLPIRVQ